MGGLLMYAPPSGAPPASAHAASPLGSAQPDAQQELPVYTASDAASLFHPTSSQLPPGYSPPRASALALPQINSEYDSPILRAYSPALKDAGISQKDWLAFQDGFNVALIGSPPLQIVDTVGKIVGFVPSVWCTVASIATQTVARTGQHIISKTLTDRYLKHNNDTFFNPRGLVVRLVKGRALRQLLGKDPKTGEPSKLAKAGSVATTVGLHLPVIRKVLNRALPAPESTRQPRAAGEDEADRRLATLSGFVASVSRDVPPPQTPSGLMDKSSALSIKMRTWNVAQKDTNNQRKLQLAAVRRGEAPASSVQAGSARGPVGLVRSGVTKATGWDRQAFMSERRAQRDARRGRGPSRRTMSKQQLFDRKAEMADDRIVWLVVLAKEQDDLIQGREEADGEGDEVVIDDDVWQEEVANEREEAEEEAELDRAAAGSEKY